MSSRWLLWHAEKEQYLAWGRKLDADWPVGLEWVDRFHDGAMMDEKEVNILDMMLTMEEPPITREQDHFYGFILEMIIGDPVYYVPHMNTRTGASLPDFSRAEKI